MRKLKIMEHISLDGVIQHSADDDDFPYSDWSAPYRTPAGRDLVLSGSSTLTSTPLEHGLADEVLLIVSPVLLGTGKRLFAEGTPARSFELVSSNAMPSGVILNAYRVAGPL